MQDTISKGNYGEDPDDITSGKDWVSQTVQDTLFKALEEKIKKDNLSEEESNKFIQDILKKWNSRGVL